MHLLDNMYVVIAIFAVGFVLFAALGMYFAIKGAKVADEIEENDFVTARKIENEFEKSAREYTDRCVLCASVFADSIYDIRLEQEVSSSTKNLLLNVFSDGKNSFATMGDDKKIIVFAKWDAEVLKEKIEYFKEKFNSYLEKRGLLNTMSITIGACLSIGAQVNVDEAIHRAKQAYVCAKSHDLDYVEWDGGLGKVLEQRQKIENNIEKEIDNNRFFLEYQPILDAQTKEIKGAEVLARLNSESEGILMPGNFLFAVDSVGVSEKFDYYIFEKNCKWISNNKEQRAAYMYTINFSRTTLCEPDFVSRIVSTVEKYGLDFSCLAIEILEDKEVTGEERKQMVNNLSVLKGKGVSILLDDFGSGVTSYDDLQEIDISIVKFDKSLTQNITTDKGFVIFKNNVRISHNIGYKTLCEGIETKEQEAAAIKAGCDFLQGYLYHKPMSVSALEELLSKK